MLTAQKKTERNLSMECCKLLASVLVVMMHLWLPWVSYVNAVACFAVPMFFAISGYFSLGASCEKLKKRMLHIIKLNILADGFHLLCGCMRVVLEGGSPAAYLVRSLPGIDALFMLAVVQHNAFLAHLWTLASTAICYLVMWIYTRFWDGKEPDYRPAYAVGFVLFLIQITLSTILPVSGLEIPKRTYTNAWFTGLPYFLLGMFLHQYQGRILSAYRLTVKKLGAALGAGLLVSIVHTGYCQYAGNAPTLPLVVISLMLLLAACPQPPSRFLCKWAPRFGTWSTAIYIIHMTMIVTYNALFSDALIARFGGGEVWLRIVIVLGMSFLGALLWEAAEKRIHTAHK